MTEMVFLPDPNTDHTMAMAELVQASGPTANVLVAAAATAIAGPAMAELASSLRPPPRARRRKPDMEIVDVVATSGATLVSMPRQKKPPKVAGGSFHPVVHYRPAVADVRVGRSLIHFQSGPAAANFLEIRLRSSTDGSPIRGAVAILVLNNGGQQISAVSDSRGRVTFGLRAPAVANADLLVEPGFDGHWGFLGTNMNIASGDVFELAPINLKGSPDGLRHLFKSGNARAGKGVRVAVIDSGVGPHVDLSNASGDADSSIGHGTHVAGIIGGRGKRGFGGVAPGVDIRSYRVFSDPSTGVARNFEIHRAIEQAVLDGCHIINLSLKSENRMAPKLDDPVISRAVEDAADSGVLSVAAAGNDGRRFVAFPARHKDVLAVSALGWEPGLPKDAYDRWTLTGDRGKPDADLFFSSFSNEGVSGTSVQLVGPGAGIVSTVPGDGYAPMSGTSMACPAITGTICRLLSQNPKILAMAPTRKRTDRMRQLALKYAKKLGFGATREGHGAVF